MPTTQPTAAPPAPLYPPSEATRSATVQARVLTEEQRAALETIRFAGATGIGSWHFAPEVLAELGARITRADVNAASTERDQIVRLAPELTNREIRVLQLTADGKRVNIYPEEADYFCGCGYLDANNRITPAGRARLEVL